MSSLKGFYAKKGDITVDVDGTVFIQRCGYLIFQYDCVLMLYAERDGNAHFYVPGGRVAVGTSSLESVVQEVLEETGIEIQPEQAELAVISERFFQHHSTQRNCHETCMFYRVTLPDAAEIPPYELDGARHQFVWLKLNQLSQYSLREHYMFRGITDITQGMHHVIHREAMDQ